MGLMTGALLVGTLTALGGGGWYYYNMEPALEEQYDFIIVGAGTAGSVLANRLSYDQTQKVLLLEAGGSPPVESWVPAASSKLQRTAHDWGYITVPQTHALKGFNKQQAYWPTGKMLGGTSSLNYMLHARGHRQDYDGWESAGCPGWGYDNLRKYFYRSEQVISERWQGSKYRNTKGEMVVSQANPSSNLAQIFVEACEQAGLSKARDFNGRSMLGCSLAQVNIKNGYRVSSYDAFLNRDVRARPNLHVITHALVTSINIYEDQAVGVSLNYYGKKTKVKAKKEIIISGGAVKSPQLLMVSGIGPKEDLESLGIPVKADLPVGRNLQDHMLLPLSFSTSVPTISERNDTLLNQLSYFAGYESPFTSNIVESVGFIDTKTDNKDGLSRPDILMYFAVTSGLPDDYKNFNMNPHMFHRLPGIARSDREAKHYVYVLPTLLTPKSRGAIKLKSGNIEDKPEIDPKYLTHDDDIATLVRGVRAAQKILDQSAWKDGGGGDIQIRKNTQECSDHDFDTDSYWRCIVQFFATTDYHPVGTCKMGAVDDDSAVVTADLKVKGIARLRVIDSSIMPVIPAANINAPTMMIAEHGADRIIKEYGIANPQEE